MSSKRAKFDFSRPATLIQGVKDTATFTGQNQLGRAFAEVGTGNGVVRLVATALGEWANDAVLEIGGQIPGGRVSVAARTPMGKPVIQLWPDLMSATHDALDLFNGFNFDPRNQLTRDQQSAFAVSRSEGLPVWKISAGPGAGDGSDAPPEGSAVLAGGSGQQGMNTFECESGTLDGGLFAFDNEEVLVLRQVVLSLRSSVAWSVSLGLCDNGYAATPIAEIASGTSQGALVSDKAIYLPPGFCIIVNAAAQGNALVTVQRP